jgi:hypothetical protein
MRIIISGHRGADPTAQRTADNRTISAADLVTDRGPGGTTDTASDSRIQGGIISTCLNSQQRKCECKTFDVHNYYQVFTIGYTTCHRQLLPEIECGSAQSSVGN